jgi:hypothetical protein
MHVTLQSIQGPAIIQLEGLPTIVEQEDVADSHTTDVEATKIIFILEDYVDPIVKGIVS